MPHNSLLIVTTFAPASINSVSLRSEIFKVFLGELELLSKEHGVKTLLIGPACNWLNRDHFVIDSDLPSKEAKLAFVHDHLKSGSHSFDFIVRLDDDDFLNPKIADLKFNDFDFITDRRHLFYDIASGSVSGQMRPWFPNTTIMKWGHAFAEPWEKGKALFFHYDHSKAWHRYAKEQNLNVKYVDDEPVYLRILSPASITSTGIRDGVSNLDKTDWMAYYRYRSGFGKWKEPKAVERGWFPIDELDAIWNDWHGKRMMPDAWQRIRLMLYRFGFRVSNKAKSLVWKA